MSNIRNKVISFVDSFVNFANKFLGHFYLELSRVNFKGYIISNVFKSKYEKKVLVSYIIKPFSEGLKYSHSNYYECYTAAKVFHELGYRVDVIDLRNKRQIDYSQYDVIYGSGEALENVFYTKYAAYICKIFYGPGCCHYFSNRQTVLKLRDFFNEKKIYPASSTRAISQTFWPFQISISDTVIALGNQFVTKTYTDINPQLNCKGLNAFYFDVNQIDLSKKDFSKAKKHFLWFGSSGLLHKGLDILIDIFSQRDDLFLHICGASHKEKRFFDYYQPILDASPNIMDHGFVDIQSEKFVNILNQCAFVVHPSVSEGGAVSVLNTIANGGLIPIIPESVGLDLNDYGFLFPNISKEIILNIVNEASQISDTDLYEKAKKVMTHVRENYSYDRYVENLKKLIVTAIKDFKENKPNDNL